MTIAQAITEIHNGNTEAFRTIVMHTAPGIWLAAALLCGNKIGRAMTEIYQEAWENVSSLHSPSDLRIWICSAAYPMLQSHLDCSAKLNGNTPEHKLFSMLSALPRDERTAVLLLCGEGCTASQAEKICGTAEIEIKRAMRRARNNLAEQAQNEPMFKEQTINTAWLVGSMKNLRLKLAQNDELYEKIYRCAVDGTAFEQDEPQTDNIKPPETAHDERGGFFSRLFRQKRF